ncbi:hypothetical protein AAHB56_28680, partial [Bacillus thuringiensis]
SVLIWPRIGCFNLRGTNQVTYFRIYHVKRFAFFVRRFTGVAILPVTLDGTYKMFEANGNRMKPAHATVTISKPITPKEYANVDIKELTKHTQEVIASQLHK